MTPQIITTLVIIAAMFALMLLNKFPLAVTMTLAGVALWITGIVEPAKLYSSFGGSTIIFLIGMSIEVYALEATGLVDMAAAKIFRGKVVEKERIAVFVTCLFSGIITGFISNTALVVLMIPVLAGAAVKSCGKLHPKYLLMGVAVEATVGESISLIGGAPNLAAQGALEAAGVETMGFFSAAPLTIVLVVITAFYFATIGYNILVKTCKFDDPLAAGQLDAPKDVPSAPLWKRLVAIGVLVGSIVCFILKVADNQVITFIGCIILWITGTVPVVPSLKNVDWNTMWNLNFCLVVASAVNTSGTGTWVANGILKILGDNANYTTIILCVAAIGGILTQFMSNTATNAMFTPICISLAQGIGGILTQFMSNTATNAMFTPICISLAQGIGVSPLAIVIPALVMVNNAVISPIGSPCMTVSLAGGYRPKDYLVVGLPLLIILIPFTVLASLLFYAV